MSHFKSASHGFQAKFWLPALAASVLLVLAHVAQDDRLLGWDEVDYAVAAGQGFQANYLDSTALTAPDFITFTKAKLKKQPSRFGSYYNEENDVFLRRHMHPPLMQYLMTATGLGRFTDGRHDQLLFGFQLAGGLVLIWMINAAVLFLINKPLDIPTGVALAVCSFLAAFHLTREIQYHLWFAICFCLVAFGLGAYLTKPAAKQAAWLGGLLGVSFLSLETGLFALVLAIFVIIITVLPPLDRQFPRSLLKVLPWRNLAIVVGVMGLTIFILWPAALLKLSLLRIISIYAYRIYLGDEYAGGNRVYLLLVARTLPLVLVGGFGVWAAWRERKEMQNRYRFAFAGLGLLYGLLMLKFLLNITYLMPALAVLSVAGLAAMADWNASGFKSIACLILLVLTGWVYFNEKPVETYATRRGMDQVAGLIEKHPALIEAGHLYKFYLPGLQARIENFNLSPKGDSITVRKDMKYEPVAIDEMKNHLILFYNRTNTPPSPIETRVRAVAKPLEIPGLSARAYLMTNDVNGPGE